MNQKQIKAAVEAMLFAAGDPVSADKLAAAVQLPQTTVETALEELRVRYAREDSGLCLLHLDTRWQLATRTEWADCIRRLLDARRSVPLGPAAMETLVMAIGLILILEGALNLLSALYTMLAVRRFIKLHPETQSMLEAITGQDLNGDGVIAPDVSHADVESTAVELDYVDESAEVEQENK